MKNFIFIILISYSSAIDNPFLGYDSTQQYSRVQIYEYTDYSNVKFLKFNIYGPTTFANWSISIDTSGKCSNDLTNIHFDLQYGAYPLIAPRNESFPETYITNRHDLFPTTFNRTVSNKTIQLINPLRGTWFALVFIEPLTTNAKSKSSSSNCNIYLTTWLDYQVVPISLTLILNQPIEISLSNNLTFAYASYYTSIGNSRFTVVSEWLSDCDIIILARINGLPNSLQYDYHTVCKHGSCSIDIDQLAAFVWIYFQISVKDSSYLINPIQGSMTIRSTECLSYNCIQSYSTRRIMFNYYYDFLYVPVDKNSSINSIILNGNDSSIYSYEFIVDDRNIGGTLHFDFQIDKVNPNVNILGCLSKNQPRRYNTCETDYQIFINQNVSTVRSLPYPEMAFWYLTLEYNCNQCINSSVSLTFEIVSTQCTRQQCGTYGTCKIMSSQQNLFSTCSCLAGYRGYGCTDDSHSYASKYLPSVLFLTLSNLMFIPAIIVAVYYRLYIEALVYFFNMFFSTFYHACDQEIRRFCLFKYDGLQLSDFIGSYASFVITLITMSIIPRSIKVFLFILGLLTCIIINARDRFDNLQFIGLVAITFTFTILTWIIVSIKKRRLQPSRRHLIYVTPGFLLAITGLVVYVTVETDENYWYTHSLWHIFMATSILFFLPHTKKQNERKQSSTEPDITTSNSPLGAINQGATIPDDEINN